MEIADNNTVREIRSFNRFYTDVLGLLNRHILDSPYSLTEVRILLEMDRNRNCTAQSLMDMLNVDRGYMSRILKRLEKDKLIEKTSSAKDRRQRFLCLTPYGKTVLQNLEDKSEQQVKRLIAHLNQERQAKLVEAMKYIHTALSENRNPVLIRPYREEDIEYIINQHRDLYEKEYGFSAEFGDYVEKYVQMFNAHHDEGAECIWIAEADSKPVGMIALVKIDDTTAQLRWFLVDPKMRGQGVGHALMRTLIEFCHEKGYKHVLLWTVSILLAARHLYKQYGFVMTETKANNTWGENIVEERWDLDL